MLSILMNFRPREAIPRLLADLLTVQLAAAASLVGVLLLRLQGGTAVDGAQLIGGLRDYYLTTFLPLSLTYPVVFLFHGLYTRSRHYSTRYKLSVALRASGVATLIYLFVNFLITRADTLPRSAAVFFGLATVCGTVGSRWLKYRLIDLEHPQAAPGPAAASGEEPVLVVGGAGYIGSILVRKLLNAGRKVRVLDSLVYGDGALRGILGHPNLELIVGDCRNIQSVVGAVNGVKSIVHLAAIVGDPACEQDQRTALEINYAATRMMVEVAKGHGIERFIFASSCSVYGASEYLMDENSEVKPVSLYGQTKVDSERALLQARTDSFHPTILRLATVFGNSYRPRFDLVVNLLTAKAYQEKVITIYNGHQWRPFIHVRDAAEGIVRVLNAPLSVVSGEIFNVGDSRLNHTLTQVAEKIRQAFPHTRVEHIENSDRRDYRVSFSKLENRLGFRCSLRLEDGIQELKRALEQGLVADYTEPRYHNQRFLQISGSPVCRDEIDSQVMAAFATAVLEGSPSPAVSRQAAR